MTPEHAAARVGKITASRFHEAIAKTKSGWGASRANYIADLVAERLTSTPTQGYISAAMQRGIELEPAARALYSFRYDAVVEVEGGFVPHHAIAMAGCSPDGLVGDEGLVQFKCPLPATHIELLLGAAIDKAYLTQMQWEMACTRRAWCDFVSYCPVLPDAMALYVRRIERDAALIRDLEHQAKIFLDEVAEKVEQLRERFA